MKVCIPWSTCREAIYVSNGSLAEFNWCLANLPCEIGAMVSPSPQQFSTCTTRAHVLSDQVRQKSYKCHEKSECEWNYTLNQVLRPKLSHNSFYCVTVGRALECKSWVPRFAPLYGCIFFWPSVIIYNHRKSDLFRSLNKTCENDMCSTWPDV